MRTARRYANASIEARRRSSTIASISETRSSVSGSQMPGERCSSRSASGSAKPKIHSVGLMADYNLSKRTDVYLQAAYQHIAGDKTNSILDQAFIPGTDAPSSTANQVAVRVALRHKF
ncbi:hypothetical protein BGV72_29630 [Burkholderia ubonensis]|nr:hypothetical protein BGV72_29630 [Burkholderia ubonensis]